jgi:WD40 repeat protein
MDDENLIRVWSADTGELVRSLSGHEDLVWALSVLPGSGLLCSGSGDGSIKVWNVGTGELVNCLLGHRRGYAVMALSTLPNDMLVSGSGDQSVRVWNVGTGCLVKTLTGACLFIDKLMTPRW